MISSTDDGMLIDSRPTIVPVKYFRWGTWGFINAVALSDSFKLRLDLYFKFYLIATVTITSKRQMCVFLR